MTVTRRIRSPGRARNKPLKPLRAGMPGDLGCTCGDYARVLHLNFAREAMGAAGTRHSPRPRGRNCPTSLGPIVPRECGLMLFRCLKLNRTPNTHVVPALSRDSTTGRDVARGWSGSPQENEQRWLVPAFAG